MVFLALVSVATLFQHPRIAERWGFTGGALDFDRLLPLLSVPALGLVGLLVMAHGLRRKAHRSPFVGASLIFLSGYIGLAVSFTPYIAPYGLTYQQAAAAPNTLSFMLVVVSVLMPLILRYTAWVYFVFRGKVRPDAGYH